MNIFIIDDSAFTRKIIKQELQSIESVDFYEAADAQSALNLLEKFQPDLITMDVNLPDGNGISLLKKIRENEKFVNVPAIVISGNTDESLSKRAFEVGAVEFMRKPFKPGKLRAYVLDLNKTHQTLEGIHVLVVDDSMLVRSTMARILHPKGVRVQMAKDGREAWEMMQQDPEIEMVITDYLMPHLNGIELSRRIRNDLKRQEVPILILTALGEHDLVLEALNAGVNDYIVKPFSREELLARIHNHARLIQAYREIRKEMKYREMAEDALKDSFNTIKDQQAQLIEELEQAKETQLAIMPEEFPMMEGLHFSATYRPMDQIGGDFYNIFKITDTTVGLMITDVSGHGVSAALISFLVYGKFFDSLKNNERSPAKAIQTTSNYLMTKLPDGRFATMFYGIYDCQTHLLRYTSAAHPAMLVMRTSTREIIQLKSTGSLLGGFASDMIPFEEKQVELMPGDKLFLYTDGIIELKNLDEEMLGLDGLIQFLTDNMDLDIQAIFDKLCAYSDEFSLYQGFDDDITMLGMEVKG